MMDQAKSGSVDEVNKKLNELLAGVSAIAERQQLHEEIMVELVTFLQAFREEAQAGQHANQQGIQSIVSTMSTLARSSAELGAAVGASVKDVAKSLEGVAGERHRTLLRFARAGLRNAPVASSRIRCVFLVHMIEAWDAQVDVYRSMLRDPRFDPVVVSINRAFSGEGGFGGEDVVSAALDGLGIPHLRLGTQNVHEAQDTLIYLSPDVIFRQSHWDVDYPPAFSTEALSFARLCVIPYGMSIVQKFSHSEPTPSSISPMAFDQPYHRSAWRIFCETNQTKAYFETFHRGQPSKLVLSGYPKHERLLQAVGNGVWPLPDTGKKVFKVIWAPHHSVGGDWLAFGVFHNIYMDMLRWAQQSPDIEFVLKPHPALFSLVVRMGYVSQAGLDAFIREWKSLPNCALCEDQYSELFAASDLMITDGLSFLTEYQLFDKPLLFLDSQRHVPFNELGQAAEACSDRVMTVQQAKDATLAYAAGKPWGHESERARLREMLFPTERPSSEIILETIAEGLGVVGQPEKSSVS